MSATSQSALPPVAVEITSERVVGARTANHTLLDAIASRPLPPQAVTPTFQEQNIADASALRQALSAVIETLGPRGRDISVVLPDAAARVMLMDFDTLPDREHDALPLVRFRLKKLLPFDADRAAISYRAIRNGMVRVVAAVAALSVVEEYEAIFRELGYNPGIVVPSIVASLGLVDGAQPTLIIKSDAAAASVAIADRGELRLVRTLEAAGQMTPEQIADDLYPLLVFFQDTFNARIERVLVGGNLRAEGVRAVIESQTGARVDDLVSTAILAPGAGSPQLQPNALAGVAGVLLNL